MTGELIVGHEKFPQFARCFYDQIGQFSVELLVSRLEDIVLGFLNLSSARNFWRKKFPAIRYSISEKSVITYIRGDMSQTGKYSYKNR